MNYLYFVNKIFMIIMHHKQYTVVVVSSIANNSELLDKVGIHRVYFVSSPKKETNTHHHHTIYIDKALRI